MLGFIAIASLVMVGMIVARRARLGLEVGGALVATLLAATVLGVGLAQWRLSLKTNDGDPTPVFLPAPFGSLLGTVGVLLVTAGPVVAGALLVLAYREGHHGSIALALLYVVGLWYVVHWAPSVIRFAFI